MPGRRPLTEIAQQAWAPYLHPGDWAIDATAGNGWDTLCLAKAVSPGGRVFAIDRQEAAIEATAARLQEAGLLEHVTLIRGDHAHMRDYLACGVRGSVSLVCFNLGYLPGGDHDITTRPETTLPALHEALLLLKPEGALSVLAYRGHEGAMREAESVESFFRNLPTPWKCIQEVSSGSGDNPGPVWWMAARA
ncbi:MAG: class I SAM-dependent methyltransferase [Puniceicoccaceae bacterium]